MPGYIPDGYTREDGFIAAAINEVSGESPYEALSFTYRVATSLERVTLDAAIRIAMKNADVDAACAVEAERCVFKFTADHLKAWDLKAVGIHPVAITAKEMERVHPMLFSKLYLIVRGDRVSDKKPEATEDSKTDEQMQKNS